MLFRSSIDCFLNKHVVSYDQEEVALYFAKTGKDGIKNGVILIPKTPHTAASDSEIVGLYILLPNNVGRCGHICNTSYAVKEGKRGLHIGEQLVKDSLKIGAE